jgi:putative copper export protein
LRQASPRALWAIPALGVAATVVAALPAHRIALLPEALSTGLAAVHVAAMSAWLGCIVVALAESRSRELARPGILAALALVLTGSGLALGNLGSAGDLVQTGYGAALSVKIALVAATFALGAAALRRAAAAAGLAVLAAAAVVVSLLPPV